MLCTCTEENSSRQEIKCYETLDIDVLVHPSSLSLQLLLTNVSWIDSVLQAPAAGAGHTLCPLTQSLDLGFLPHPALQKWNEASGGAKV